MYRKNLHLLHRLTGPRQFGNVGRCCLPIPLADDGLDGHPVGQLVLVRLLVLPVSLLQLTLAVVPLVMAQEIRPNLVEKNIVEMVRIKIGYKTEPGFLNMLLLSSDLFRALSVGFCIMFLQKLTSEDLSNELLANVQNLPRGDQATT